MEVNVKKNLNNSRRGMSLFAAAALFAASVAGGALYAGRPASGGAEELTAAKAAAKRQLTKTANKTRNERLYDQMSTYGAIAAGIIERPDVSNLVGNANNRVIGGSDVIVSGGSDLSLQSETSIASNPAGTVLIAGYNEQRGFAVAPVSVSGISRSTDGGTTWDEIPVGPGGLGVLPGGTGQVFGDPEIEWSPTLNGGAGGFVYASIFVNAGVQGMCIHTSDPTGTTWTGPIPVTSTFIAGAAADKEFIDVNQTTGRILMSWTNFPAGPAEIRTTFSTDNGATWSPSVVIGMDTGFVQSSMPSFRDGTNDAYVVWRTIDGAGLRNVSCSRSTDNGVTWSPQTDLDSSDFAPEDFNPGNDRINTSPALDINNATGQVFVVYQRNNAVGTGDIAFRTFTGNCVAAAPVLINSNPGNDRYQWYPSITVDQASGQVAAIWLDQDPEDSGDLTEAMVTKSTNNGTSWTPPTPVLDAPFHAGYGNDGSQPNMGDYNQAVFVNGILHSTWGATDRRVRYDSGQPTSGSTLTPDTYYDKRVMSDQIIPLRLRSLSTAEASCNALGNTFLDPTETADLTVTLENYVTNPVASPATITGISGTLSTSTPNVTIDTASASWANIAAGATGANTAPFKFTLGAGFVPGAEIDFILTLNSGQGTTQIPLMVDTGTPGTSTTLLSENFEAIAPPALPAGWTVINGGPAMPDDPWVTAAAPLAGTAGNWLFHDNDGALEEFRRAASPIIAIPAVAGESYVILDFDIRYNTEDEPSQLVTAYDGLTLRITDQTPANLLRSVLTEAFAKSITTGTMNHFPKHLPRDNSAPYFQDMSVWAGDSGGVLHVRKVFRGLGMTGRMVQLRWEYTEDGNTACPVAPCGVAVDNIVMRIQEFTSAACPTSDLAIAKTAPGTPIDAGDNITYTLTVTNNGPAAATNASVSDTLPAGTSFVSASGTGWTCNHAAGVVTCTAANLVVGPAPAITLIVNVNPNVQTGTINNTAAVTADQFDAVATTNSSTAPVSIRGSSVLAIPTLSTVGWISLVALLAGAALFMLRRRV